MDMKKILQAIDTVASLKPVEGSNDMKKFVQIVNESATPHKVSLPVQMAMNHYQEPKVNKDSAFRKYFKEAEEVVAQQETEKKQHLQMYAQVIAKRVLENKKNTNEGAWDKIKSFGKDTLGMNSPEDLAAKDPNGQMAQLLQLRAKYKGTQFERQIEDRIKNLAFRLNGGHGAPMGADGQPKAVVPPEDFNKQNPSFVREADKQKGVDGKACWDGYKRMGTKKKGGKTVDNCVPTGKK
jgi:hypothetical protein